MALNCCAHSV